MSWIPKFLPLAVAASLAACSGNLGGGQSTLPGAPQNGTSNVQQVTPPTPTASPLSAANVATIGDTVAPQALPAVMGYGGTIAFAKPSPAASAAGAAKPAGSTDAAAASAPISIGVTAGVVEPADAPRFSSAKGRRSGGKHGEGGGPKGLLFVSLLATADVTLGEYPKIAIDVPRAVVSKYLDYTFALGLYDPATKEKTYRLAVAERDLTSPAPGSMPVTTPAPTPAPTVPPTMPPGAMSNGAPAFTPPPIGSGLDASALPPEHVAFLATAASLTLKANRPVVFALYAVPPSPSPSPTATSTPNSSSIGAPSSAPPASAAPSATP